MLADGEARRCFLFGTWRSAVAELFANSRSQQLAAGQPSDVLARCWILASAERDRSLNLLGKGGRVTLWLRVSSCARGRRLGQRFRSAAGLLLRSPVLEEAERWIASRPRGAPEPTEETQQFVAASRRGTTRRRNILTGSLAAGLVVALALAGLAYWQRGIAVEQRQIAEQQRKRAEDTLAAATKTANSLVFDLAQRFRDVTGVPAALVKDILDRARALQEQLIKSGQVTPELKSSEATALDETATSLLEIGDTAGALGAAEQGGGRSRRTCLPAIRGARTSSAICRCRISSWRCAGCAGRFAGALKSFRDSLAIRERLVQSDPGNATWQRELSVPYIKVGDVQVAQGDLAGAFESLPRQPRHHRAVGAGRSRQRRLAARSR